MALYFLLPFNLLGQTKRKNIEKVVLELQQNPNIKTATDFTKTTYYQNFTKLSSDSIMLLISYADEIEQVSFNILVKEEHGNLVRTIGSVFYYKNINEYAIKYFKKSLEVFYEIDNKKEIARTLSNIAVMNEIAGNYSRALEQHYKALETMKVINDKKGISFVLNNIAVTYVEMNNYSKALTLYKQSLAIKKELTDSAGMAATSNNIGVLFGERFQNTDSMNFYLDISLSLYKALGDSVNYATSLNNLSEIYLTINQFQKAKENSQKALEILEAKSHKKGIANCMRNLAHAELKLDNYKLCKEHLTISEQILEELNDNTKRLEILQLKQELYTKTGKKNQALNNFNEFIKLKDSLENKELNKAIANTETKYKVFEKENEITILENKNQIRNQQIVLSITISVSLVLLLLLGALIFIKVRKSNKLEREQLKQQLFRSQMNPHFMFNALGSIQNFLYKNEAKKAANYLGNFSSLTRSILTNSTKESITLEEEIETLKNYLELEKMRMKEAFNYEISYNENLETEFITIPPMLIQPFVENAIKHGLKDKEEGGHLRISFTDKKNLLEVQVTDNGIGIDNSKRNNKKEHKSMAISIFNQRMKIIRKQSKQIPLPKIEDLSINGMQGTLVEISLPILN